MTIQRETFIFIKENRKMVAYMNTFRYYVLANYVVVQVLALIVGKDLWIQGVMPIEPVAEAAGSALPLVLFGLVLLTTLALLILIKYGLSYLLYYFTEYGLLFALVFFLLYFLFPDLGLPVLYSLYPSLYVSLVAAGAAVVLRYKVNQFNHVSVIIFAVGAAAILGSLNVYYVIAFFVLLSLYDIVAVRLTGHMQKVADDVFEKGSSLMFTLKTKEELFELGTADIVLPSTLVVSVFIHYSREPILFPLLGALLCSGFALIGLSIATRQKVAPALPYASLSIMGFFAVEIIRVTGLLH